MGYFNVCVQVTNLPAGGLSCDLVAMFLLVENTAGMHFYIKLKTHRHING